MPRSTRWGSTAPPGNIMEKGQRGDENPRLGESDEQFGLRWRWKPCSIVSTPSSTASRVPSALRNEPPLVAESMHLVDDRGNLLLGDLCRGQVLPPLSEPPWSSISRNRHRPICSWPLSHHPVRRPRGTSRRRDEPAELADTGRPDTNRRGRRMLRNASPVSPRRRCPRCSNLADGGDPHAQAWLGAPTRYFPLRVKRLLSLGRR
jgi:hypothetical protein